MPNGRNAAETVLSLTRWLRVQGEPEVQNNMYKVNPAPFRLPQVLLAAAKGSECFDCAFYLGHNRDLVPAFKASPMQCVLLFNHWINYGQFEGRPSKYAPCSRPLPLVLCLLLCASCSMPVDLLVCTC